MTTAPRRSPAAPAPPRALSLAALLAAALLLSLAPGAEAAAPTIVNTGANAFENDTASRESGDSANHMEVLAVVKHDPGRRVTGLRIDTDYDGTDESSSASLRTVTAEQPSGVAGGFNYSRAFLSFANTVSNIACGDRPGFTHTIYMRAVLDDGSTTGVVSAPIFFTPSGGCTGFEDYAYMYGQTVINPVQVNTGGTANYHFKFNDPDSGNNVQGFFWHLRRLDDGAIAGGTVVCPGDIDDADQSLTVTFPSRGHWVVEAAAREGSTCTSNGPGGNYSGRYWRIGAADVNTPQASSPALSLSATRPQLNQPTTLTATTDDNDDSSNGGAPQYIEWDCDNNGVYEKATLGTGTLTGAGQTSNTLTSAEKQTTCATTGKAPGTYTVRARVTDNGAINGADNIRRQTTASTTYLVDSPPVLTAPGSATTDAGSAVAIALSASDANSDTLTFSTTAGPTNGTGVFSGTGNSRTYTYTPAANYAGPDSVTFQVSDGFGGTDTKTVAISVYPTTTIDTGPSGRTNNNSPTFTYSSQSGASFECQLDGGGFAACPSSGKGYSNLPDGPHTFEVRAISGSGNLVDQSPATRSFTVDTQAPETTIESGRSGRGNSTAASFTFFSETGATFECELEGPGHSAGFTSCSSPKDYSSLADGAYTFSVRATDQAANTDQSPAARPFTVDTQAPETTIDSGPSDPTSDSTPTFGFSSNDSNATFECRLYPSADPAPSFGACSGPGTSHTSDELADGRYTFEVRATDEAGNTDESPATRSFTVDTTAPETTITASPPPISGSGSATFEFSSSEAGSTFECRLDATDEAAFTPCASPKTYTGLANGLHTFEVRASDPAGNTDASPASSTFTVADTTAPETSIVSGPSNPTNDTSPTFEFSSSEEGSTFECKLTGPGHTGGFASCTSPEEYAGLQAGDYTFEVRATDAGGNTDRSPATRSFTVDTQAPETEITGGPSGPTRNRSPSFSFTSETGASFECKLEGPGQSAGYTNCSSPKDYTDLADGDYTFSARATDEASNTDSSPATRSFTVDTAAPDTTIESGRSGRGNSTAASFTFSSETGASFECKLEGPGQSAGYTNCSSPKDYTGLDEGDYTFSVRATDEASNTDASPATRSFTVDTATPDTEITGGPTGLTRNASPSFSFTSETGASFECKLEGPGHSAGFTSCTSPKDYTDLADGAYTFSVRATDEASNTDASPATRSFTVDTATPDTEITGGPTGLTRNASPSFSFTSETGASFECKLEGPGHSAGFTSCTSPKDYTDLADGAYTFSVRATDEASNTDQSPATRSFTVDTQAPNAEISGGPTGLTRNVSPSFSFTSEGGASFVCKLEGPGQSGGFTGCTSPRDYSSLDDGAYTFSVRATDQAANTDSSPATRSFTVDTTPPDTTIVSGPSDPTTEASPRFTFSSESGASFECLLDGPEQTTEFGACGSPKDYSGLADGRYTFSVRATDAAGNTDQTPASHGFTIKRQSSGGPDPDRDTDGVPDASDRCPDQPGTEADGCPSQPQDRTAPVPTFPASDRAISVGRSGLFSFTIGGCSELAPCDGSVSFSSVAQSRSARSRPLAVKRFRLQPGGRVRLKVRLRRPDLRRLGKKKTMRVRATVVLADRAGNSSRRRYTFTLRVPRRK